MLSDDEITRADDFMKYHLTIAETFRREHPNVTPGPLPGFMDYAASGTIMDAAMAHLRESVPLGQHQRTLHAWSAFKTAVAHHDLWLRERGFL